MLCPIVGADTAPRAGTQSAVQISPLIYLYFAEYFALKYEFSVNQIFAFLLRFFPLLLHGMLHKAL